MNQDEALSKGESDQDDASMRQTAEESGHKTLTDKHGAYLTEQLEAISSPLEEISQYSQQAWEADAGIRQEVEEITDAFKEGVETESSLTEKVENLRSSLDSITEEVQSWRGKNSYLEAIDNVKQQVDDIHREWDSLSTTLTTQRERVETLLQTFPSIIETSTLKALTLRVSHLEELVHDLIQERESKSNSEKARKQLIVSMAALGLTVVFWGAFLAMSILG